MTSQRVITLIVLHSATAFDPKAKRVVHQSKDEIDRYHREHNGWRKIGYHWYVEHDGHGVRGRADHEVGAHVGGLNLHSLGLCVSGHGDIEPWNPAQRREVIRQCAEWCQLYGLGPDHLIGHREAEKHGAAPVWKTCPGVLVDLEELRHELDAHLGGLA